MSAQETQEIVHSITPVSGFKINALLRASLDLLSLPSLSEMSKRSCRTQCGKTQPCWRTLPRNGMTATLTEDTQDRCLGYWSTKQNRRQLSTTKRCRGEGLYVLPGGFDFRQGRLASSRPRGHLWMFQDSFEFGSGRVLYFLLYLCNPLKPYL